MLSTAHQIELKPNNKQANYFARACGVARFSFNWGLEQWQTQYQAHVQDNSLPKPNEQALRKQFNAVKKQEFGFVLEVTKYAAQQALKNVGTAFKRFFTVKLRIRNFIKKAITTHFILATTNLKSKTNRYGYLI